MARGGDTRSDHLSPRRAVKAPGVLLDRARALGDAYLVDGRRTALSEVVAACLAVGLPVLERDGLQVGLDALEGLKGAD